MILTKEEERVLNGADGNAAAKSMKILVALGEIYGAEKLIPVGSVQVAGVSYDNLGDAGLAYLDELARDGQVKVLTTLNPAGMDLRDWRKLGISDEFAGKQQKVVEAFSKMGIVTTCTCTPYLIGNLPSFGEHVAWAESSAVTFANSVIGARSNREGGPSAIAAAMVGKVSCMFTAPPPSPESPPRCRLGPDRPEAAPRSCRGRPRAADRAPAPTA